jgi:tetratricopeptide (TPR) repeat protein
VWNVSTLDTLLCPGDSIRVGRSSRADLLLFATDAVLRIDQLTTLQIVDPAPSGPSLLDLIRGAIHFFSRLPQALEVRTPFVSAGVEGTEFVLRVEQDRTLVSVFEGLVRLTNDQGDLLLAADQSGEALDGQAPQLRLVARPRDEVQWALYYQPLSTPLIESAGPALRESMEALRGGDLSQAVELLERVPESDRKEAFHIFRAGLRLSVGRVTEALEDLKEARRVAPQSGEADALQAVIDVARNNSQQALENGLKAVRLSPRSSAAKIALSYAQQVNFELEAARDTLQQLVNDQPDDSLARARLAELHLSLGDLDRALEEAEEANSRGPELGRTRTVLGFARLTQMKISDARAAFERALELESESSLARLGLGLARIRDGDLEEGRREIEIAVSLDPNNALIRSYLGKAYFEERRDAMAGEQLDLAKQLDPNDPTPYFYDAIRKQTTNRPVEAL